MQLDSFGRPHISYFDWINYDLKHAYHDGTVWQIQTVGSSGYVGKYTSLALDTSDRSHSSYYDISNGDLKYASYDGLIWQIQTVDREGRWAGYLARKQPKLCPDCFDLCCQERAMAAFLL